MAQNNIRHSIEYVHEILDGVGIELLSDVYLRNKASLNVKCKVCLDIKFSKPNEKD
jgi:hypothetical protein